MESLKVKTVELQYFDGLTNVAVVCWQFFCVWFLSRLIVHNFIYIYLFNIITHTVHTYSNTLIIIEHKISISVICKEFNAP